MIEFLFADINTGYSIALFTVVCLALLEGVGILIGLSVMNLLDHISPIDLDVDFDADLNAGGLTPLLGWLCLNRLPLLIWLVLFFTSFGIIGFTLNYISLTAFDIKIPELLSYSLSLLAGFYTTHLLGGPLGNLLPKNESSAISNDSFSGLVATITIGTAKKNSPAEASVIDNYSQKHYVMVAPENLADEFTQGDKVVLVEKQEKFWLAIKFTQ
jgi:hypothetical protein